MSKALVLGEQIVVQPDRVAAIYDAVRDSGAALPVFCTENPWMTQAAIAAVDEMAQELGLAAIPTIISATGHYEGRAQLADYAPGAAKGSRDSGVLGLDHMIWDIERALECVQSRLLVMTHLDHAHPRHDAPIIEYGLEHNLFSTIMYDCSHLPLEENIRMTRAFVERTRGRCLVEGIVDQIYEAGAGAIQDKLTAVEDAVRYCREVEPFIIVANLGTEHRASLRDYQPEYHPERAIAITQALGRRMLCLHGTSCLGDQGLQRLKDDGIIKVNVWTKMERDAAAALADYIQRNWERVVDRPSLDWFPANRFRDAWMSAVKEDMRAYMLAFGYDSLRKVERALREV